MFSFLVTSALALLAASARANPVPTANATADFSLTAVGPIPHPALALAARQEFPAILFLCPDAACGCATTTSGINIGDLLSLPVRGICFTNDPFASVGIVQPSGQGLGITEALVGPPGCAQFFQIPAVNECFSVTGPKEFDQFKFMF